MWIQPGCVAWLRTGMHRVACHGCKPPAKHRYMHIMGADRKRNVDAGWVHKQWCSFPPAKLITVVSYQLLSIVQMLQDNSTTLPCLRVFLCLKLQVERPCPVMEIRMSPYITHFVLPREKHSDH